MDWVVCVVCAGRRPGRSAPCTAWGVCCEETRSLRSLYCVVCVLRGDQVAPLPVLRGVCAARRPGRSAPCTAWCVCCEATRSLRSLYCAVGSRGGRQPARLLLRRAASPPFYPVR